MITRGSEWSKWDLHLHSKYSLENRTKMEIEDIFKQAVECQIKMISITDHSNVDSLDEIWDVYENGKCDKGNYRDLLNFLPGIELKTDKGQHGVHIICIFPKEISIEGIEVKTTKAVLYDNFCAKLNLTKTKVSAKGDGDYSKGLLNTPVSFDDAINLAHHLGGLVIIHGGDKHGSIENEIENPSEYTPEGLYKSLDITKTDIMSNKIDIIELPNFNRSHIKNATFYMKTFRKPCIVGSDSHEKKEYYKLGNKFTWIKANNTFNGLKQAIVDYKNRIYLKEIPEQLERVRKEPTKFLDEIKIEWEKEYDGNKGEWFNNISIPLNSGLISIIGNKGNGKSALAEIIAWTADSKNYSKFAFLNNKKFQKNKLANNFIGKLKFKSDNLFICKSLADKPEPSSVERVQCIPQQYFDEICTDTELDKLTNEINAVIFSRLNDDEKENETTLENLIEKYTKSTNRNIEFYINELSNKNKQIISLENKLKPSYLEIQNQLLKDYNVKLEAHKKICPLKVEKPILSEKKQKEYDSIIKQIESFSNEIHIHSNILSNANIQKNNLKIIKNSLHDLYNRFLSERSKLEEDLQDYNIDINDTINIQFDTKNIETKISEYEEKIKKEKDILGDTTKKCGLKYKLKIKENNRDIIVSEESKNIKLYDQYLKNLEEWEKENVNKKIDVEKIENEIKYVSEEIHNELDKLYSERNYIAEKIYNEKKKIVSIYDRFKVPIDNFLKEHNKLLKEYSISIRSGLVIKDSFEEEFFRYINKQRRNVFRDDQYVLNKTIDELLEIENIEDYIKIPNLIINKMKQFDLSVSDQIKGNKILDFYNYIYGLEYITNKYELISDSKTLDKLSPGERGALLLIFYLLLDMRDIPLLIDQPEDNLDNQSVTKVLVPFIQEAKNRRQIIMVTHNPNLAVVADSDQIIHVKIDKENNQRVIVESGGIEDIVINECLVTILEGTMNSFRKREEKYI